MFPSLPATLVLLPSSLFLPLPFLSSHVSENLHTTTQCLRQISKRNISVRIRYIPFSRIFLHCAFNTLRHSKKQAVHFGILRGHIQYLKVSFQLSAALGQVHPTRPVANAGRSWKRRLGSNTQCVELPGRPRPPQFFSGLGSPCH